MKCHFGISSTVDSYNQDYDWFLLAVDLGQKNATSVHADRLQRRLSMLRQSLTEKDGDGYINL